MATHFTFSDETQFNVGRFRAIGALSVAAELAEPLQSEVSTILRDCSVSELKWEKVRTAKDRLAALAVVKWVLNNRNSLCIDVLMWDTEDSRHAIRGRDDIENLHRMHHHLMKHILTNRGDKGSSWILRPDEHTAMRWKEVGDFLYRTSMATVIQPVLGKPHTFKLGVRPKYTVEDIVPAISHEQPLVQVADMFAGMMTFSWKSFASYRHWLRGKHGQSGLFPAEQMQPSKGETEKCCVLDCFHTEIKKLNSPISLMSSHGLRTHAWRHPFNFWIYQPQTNLDKAPVRNTNR